MYIVHVHVYRCYEKKSIHSIFDTFGQTLMFSDGALKQASRTEVLSIAKPQNLMLEVNVPTCTCTCSYI